MKYKFILFSHWLLKCPGSADSFTSRRLHGPLQSSKAKDQRAGLSVEVE